MKRFALTLTASALPVGDGYAQTADEAASVDPSPAVGTFADADGDGIANHADEDFVRPGLGQCRGQGRRGRGNGAAAFVDADGDGVNDLAPDADGDGVANCLDDDYRRPGLGPDGSGTTANGGRGAGRSQARGRR